MPGAPISTPTIVAAHTTAQDDRDFVDLIAAGLTPEEAADAIGQPGRATRILRRPGVALASREAARQRIDGLLLPCSINAVHKRLTSDNTSASAIASLARVVLSAAGLLRPTQNAVDPLPLPGGPAPDGADVPKLGEASEAALRAMQGQLAGLSQQLATALRPEPIDVTPEPNPLE